VTEIDEVPVASLSGRYGVNRSQIYVRLDALKRLDPTLIPKKRGKKAFISSQMLDYLDGIAALLQQGFTTDQAAERVLAIAPPPDLSADSLARQDTTSALGNPELMALLLANLQREPEDDLAVFRKLQELADNDWRPSTSQLTKILDLASLPGGEDFERYGFRFVRAGKNGAETAWKVEKV